MREPHALSTGGFDAMIATKPPDGNERLYAHLRANSHSGDRSCSRRLPRPPNKIYGCRTPAGGGARRPPPQSLSVVLGRDGAIEAVGRVWRLPIRELNDGAVAQNNSRNVLPGCEVGGTLNPH